MHTQSESRWTGLMSRLGGFEQTVYRERTINPILPPHSADPWMILHDGWYYYCESRNNTRIRLRKSKTIHGIAEDPGSTVWTAPSGGMNCSGVWAPELHLIQNRWFIYYAADDGENENHRMWVLESTTDSPMGPYVCRGCLDTEGWAIDGTVLTQEDGSLYFVWSGWPGKKDGRQNLYIAPMKDPATILSSRILLAKPEHPWERNGMPICEGPQVLRRNGKTFIVYSASASWTPDYCLGLLINRDGNVMNPKSWEKRGPVFAKTDEIWGIGHCSFVKSPCQTEDWILYHAKSDQKPGWVDRDVHAKKFSWKEDDLPEFGIPPARTRCLMHLMIDGEPSTLVNNASLIGNPTPLRTAHA